MSSASGFSSLTELDLATLFRNAANWPLPGKAALGLAVACLWLGLGDTFYLSPSREQLHRQQTREVVLQQEVVRKAEIATNLEDNARQLQSLRGSFARLLQQLPLDTEVPALLEDITRLGTANGLVFEEIRLLDEQDRSLYIELPLQIGVIGAYHDLATFISAMAGLSRIVTVHDFTINPVGPHAGAPIRLNLLAKTYRYNDQDGTGLQVSEADLNQPSTPAENRAQRFVYDSVTLRDPFQPPFRLRGDRLPRRMSGVLAGFLKGLLSSNSRWSAPCPVGRKPSFCCGVRQRCIVLPSAITWGWTTAGSRPFMTRILNSSSFSLMARTRGSNAREPLP